MRKVLVGVLLALAVTAIAVPAFAGFGGGIIEIDRAK